LNKKWNDIYVWKRLDGAWQWERTATAGAGFWEGYVEEPGTLWSATSVWTRYRSRSGRQGITGVNVLEETLPSSLLCQFIQLSPALYVNQSLDSGQHRVQLLNVMEMFLLVLGKEKKWGV